MCDCQEVPHTQPSIYLLRLLPVETAHHFAIWALSTGWVYRIGFIFDGLVTLAWAWPALKLLRWAERNAKP